MTKTNIRAERQRAIQNQIARLERRLAPLRAFSNRVSWLRVGVFFAGLGTAVVVGTQINALVGGGVLLVATLMFIAVVLYHQRLERWVDTLATWRAFRADQLARMTHDWERVLNHSFAGGRDANLALDLDLTGVRSLHQLLDTTLSRQASQLLADWLTTSHPQIEQVHARQAIVRELLAFTHFRERFGRTFRVVLREPLEGEKLAQWLATNSEASRLRWALPVATGLVALNLVLVALSVFGDVPAYWIFSLLIYLAFYIFNQSWLGEAFGALSRMEAELTRFNALLRFLERARYEGYPHLAELCAPFRAAHNPPSTYTRKINLVAIGVGVRSNPVFGLVLNLIAPWDFLFAYLTERYRVQVVALFPEWWRICYHLDAYMALANFAYSNPDYAFPTIARTAQPIFAAQNLGHPLIPHTQNVRNDFSFDALGEIGVITGSNMAGKSTFLKSVGVNLCLAYVGAPVVATALRATPLRLATCIHISDSVTDGFSFFYAEVKCLKRLLVELQTRHELPLLFLIDEIFRGTNNRERLLGSRAFIQALLKEQGVGLVATHDLELAHLAEQYSQIHNYHFRDDVADGKLVFDYKIRTGACPTTNALKIMRMEGLPIPTE